jgi:hypothetical protein
MKKTYYDDFIDYSLYILELFVLLFSLTASLCVLLTFGRPML